VEVSEVPLKESMRRRRRKRSSPPMRREHALSQGPFTGSLCRDPHESIPFHSTRTAFLTRSAVLSSKLPKTVSAVLTPSEDDAIIPSPPDDDSKNAVKDKPCTTSTAVAARLGL
jgi:hypothetical protein